MKARNVTLERAFHHAQNNNPFAGVEARALLK